MLSTSFKLCGCNSVCLIPGIVGMDDLSPHNITSEISLGDFAAEEAKPEAGGHLTQQDQPLQRQNFASEPFVILK